MSWAYVSTSGADKDWVRLVVGDTSSGSQRLQDEEITALLTAEGSRSGGAAAAAEAIGAYYAGRADSKTVGRLSITYGQMSERFFKLATRLRATGSMAATPYAGGISIADKGDDQADTDRVVPSFFVGQFERSGYSADMLPE